MRIRYQLILAAFLLAVLPLAAIVTYSYHSSRRALEHAYRREADRLTGQMDKRLASIRAELDQRLTFVSALPLPSGAQSKDVGNIVTVMGDAAGLVDALEFHPVPNVPPPAVVMRHDEPAQDEDTEVAEPAEAMAAATPAPPAPPAEPVVIEIPPMPEFPRFVMSEEQKEAIAEVSRLGAELGNQNLSEEERKDIREELKAAQQELKRAVGEDREEFEVQMREAQHALQERQKVLERVREEHAKARARRETAVTSVPTTPAVAQVPAAPPVKTPKPLVREATQKDLAKSAATAKKTQLILGRNFGAPVRQEGEVVGQLTARISPEQVIRRVLGGAADDRSEIPFAVDREGTLYTRNEEERARLESLGVLDRVRNGKSLRGIEGWIVSSSVDAPSGMRIGVARPVGETFDDLRRTAARNFAIGLGLIVFALIGIVPFSNHLTRDVKIVTDGADRIAHGDLMTRLPVKSDNELGQLARAFNRMAEDLSLQQQKLLEQERTRKEQELQQRLLAVEYDRKSFELEEARRFQLSMLPKEVPHHPSYGVAVFTQTATEVGGDYYDFHLADDVLSVTIGDATGHGAKAGTMVTVIKTLFAGYDGQHEPSEFLGGAAEKIKRMDLGRMAMALSLARFAGRRLTVASAGMPPALVHRAATHTIDELALSATPLGTLGTDYAQADVELASGDTVLFLSDGFPELMNDSGHQLGYTGAMDAFAAAATAPNAEAVIARLAEEARRWHGDAPPNDDVTFVVVRVA
ncbi:MAG TPA: SpoIIE family protein phosphatase [Thermoanaerobaculia bacterium]|nr:SpoIIE family protein phosphatase [Thermoanaerobaculia bacterium]